MDSIAVAMLSREVNPVTFVLEGGNAKIKIEAGFAKKTEPGIPKEHYVLRIQK